MGLKKHFFCLFISPYRPFDLCAALRTLRARVRHLAPSANQINALRNEEFDCAQRACRRPAFNPEANLDVVFVDEDGQGEGAIDDGGPTREFCRLLMVQLQGHGVFEGPLEARTLALDSVGILKHKEHRHTSHAQVISEKNAY